jgi:hypothetical protein
MGSLTENEKKISKERNSGVCKEGASVNKEKVLKLL